MDSAIQRVNFKITRLDDEILKTVREQSAESSKGTQNLESAQRAIHVRPKYLRTKKRRINIFFILLFFPVIFEIWIL